MNAEKAKKKYFEMYPEEINKRRGKENIDDDHVVSLMFSGKKLEAMRYVQEVAGIGSNAASRYIEKVYFVAKVNQHPTNEVEAMVVAMNNSDLSKGSGRSVADELSKLKALLDQGVLTQEEFDAQKQSCSSNNGLLCQSCEVLSDLVAALSAQSIPATRRAKTPLLSSSQAPKMP